MLEARVYADVTELPDRFALAKLPYLAAPGRVLMGDPTHFDVNYAINPHMVDRAGELRRPDREIARLQWDGIRRTWEALGLPVTVMSGAEGLPDLVFVTNLATVLDQHGACRPRVILSRMRYAERVGEPQHARRALSDLDFEVLELPDTQGLFLEGHGDLLWSSGRRLLFGGHGLRTSCEALHEVARLGEAPVVALELEDPRFYHLDACLMPLDEGRAAWVPEAFSSAGRELLEAVFGRLLPLPFEEAVGRLAANATCLDGRNVVIDGGCPRTAEMLAAEGFVVHPCDTSEFLKAGGSVHCLTLPLPCG